MTDSRGIQVKTVNREGHSVIEVRGEVDLRSSPQLRELLIDAVERADGPMLVDLSDVGYMDSSGVGTMVFIKREAERKGRKIVLIGLQQRVRSVFEITHLDKFFTIVDDLSEVDAS